MHCAEPSESNSETSASQQSSRSTQFPGPACGTQKDGLFGEQGAHPPTCVHLPITSHTCEYRFKDFQHPYVTAVGTKSKLIFFFFLLPKEQIKTARFCWFQMQSFGFCDFFSLLKGILMNNTNPFVPRFPFLKRLCQDNIIHQGENVSTGGCSSFAEGLPCLFLNRN